MKSRLKRLKIILLFSAGEDNDDDFGRRGQDLLQELLETKEQVKKVSSQLDRGSLRKEEHGEATAQSQRIVDEDSSSETDVYEDPMAPEDLVCIAARTELIVRKLKNAFTLQSCEILASLQSAVHSLNKDVESIQSRVSSLEKESAIGSIKQKRGSGGLSGTTLTFLVVWPFLAQGIVHLASAWRRGGG